MINVLYVIPPLGNGGVEKMVLSWISGFDRNKLHVDIITLHIEDPDNYDCLISMGCNVYEMPFRYRQFRDRKNFLNGFFSKNIYDVVHVHTCTSLDYLPLMLAKKNGCKITVSHSHSSGLGNSSPAANFLHKLYKGKLIRWSDFCIACSSEAAIHLYGKRVFRSPKYLCVKNGIDTHRFEYNDEIRHQIRKQFEVDDDTVILGYVARYDVLKRHDMLVRIFYELIKLGRIKYKLLLIGKGETKEKICELCKTLNICHDVVFIDNTNDVHKYLCAMDMCVFTSEREGLSVSLIEAQCTGLICLASEKISAETCITSHIYTVPYDKYDDISYWVSCINDLAANSSGYDRKKDSVVVYDSGFDIQKSCETIQKIYFKVQ